MAFTGQSFSFNQVLTAAEMNQISTNIDEVRTFHKGSSAPAEREAGVMWLDDDPAPWSLRMYKNSSQSIELCQIDPTNDRVLYPTDSIVVPFDEQILYLDFDGTEQTLIGTHPTLGGSSKTIFIEAPPGGFQIDVTTPSATTLLTISGNDGVNSGGTGQFRALAGTQQRPTYSFQDAAFRAGMWFEPNSSAPSNPGVLGFSAGEASTTWHFFLTAAGNPGPTGLLVGRKVTSFGVAGVHLCNGDTAARGQVRSTVNSSSCLWLNRTTNDGQMVVFYQDGTEEGDISVSGTTVALNGAHLGRMSQLPDLGPRREIVRGTVMAAAPQKCEWFHVQQSGTDRYAPEAASTGVQSGMWAEANEQLVRCEVSSTPGDRTVYGIFDRWADISDGWDFDFYVASVGDFVCRVTGPAAPGDLLESAGDGTARVQSDDLLRAGTIAKVSLGAPTATLSQENVLPVQLLIG